MKYIQLGNSDLKVSKMCLGCMGFGEAAKGMHSWTLDQDATNDIIQYALENGINFFDTAMGYSNGTSEIFLGKAIKKFAQRKDVVIATKFLPRTKEQIENGISAKEHIRTCLENSLKRLDMDYIDLYLLHMWDWQTPILETLEALDALINEGKIKAIGISNVRAFQLAKANEIAKAHGLHPFIAVQNHYNLIHREEEREMVLYCQEENIAMMPYSALAAGRLAKKPDESSKRLEQDAYAKFKYDKTAAIDSKIITRVLELSEKKGCTMTEIALAWLYSKVTVPVVGATKVHHIDGAVHACDIELNEEEKNYLEELYTPHALVGVMATNK